MKSETSIQADLFKIIVAHKLPGVLVWHTPNGEKRDPRTARRLKQMGVLPGVPDIGFIAEQRTGFLELKRADGHLSDDQLDFIATCANHGVRVHVAYSVIEGAQILQQVGVLDPTIKFTVSQPQVGRGARGRTARQKAVRSSNTEAARVPA